MPNLETAGWYNGTVVGQKLGKSEKGSFSLKFTLEVADGECKGQHAWWDAYLTIAAIQKTLEKLRKVFGYEGDEFGLRTADFVGMPVRFLLEPEEYNGKTTMKVKAVTSADAGGAFGYQPPADDDFADFLHSIGAESPATAGGQIPENWGGTETRPTGPKPQTQDPIPF